MLIDFSVENHLSFSDSVSFSSLATKEARHSERIARGRYPWLKILPSALFYGGNASGKSNLVKSIDFAKFLLVSGTKPERGIPTRAFKLNPDGAKQSSKLSFRILVDERVFHYSFAVNTQQVISEELTEIRATTERPIFSRSRNPDNGEQEFNIHWINKRSVSEEDRQFIRFVAKGTRDNQLFLRESVDRNIKELNSVYRWFNESLVIISPDTAYQVLDAHLDKRSDLRQYANELLRNADTGIDSISGQVVPIESLGLPDELKESLETELNEDGGGIFLRSTEGHRFSIFRQENKLVASRIISRRKDWNGKYVDFDASEESDGTRRLIDLLPIFHDLELKQSAKTYIIDELDRSMHTVLCRALIQRYHAQCTESGRNQLIFTTHDTDLLDQSLFRRDEIWFVQRDPKRRSHLVRLSDNKSIRYDKDIRKDYLEGRFGGIPLLEEF
jgi:AAA15 family ATPase/GTPase